MGIFVHPAVPMAIHQILVDAASGLAETGKETVDVGGTLDGEVGDEDDLCAVGRNLKAFEAVFDSGHHLLGFTLDVNGNDVITTGKKEGVRIQPHGVKLVLRGIGKADGTRLAIGWHHIQLGIAFVLLHVVIGGGESDACAVGAHIKFAHFSQLPHQLRGEVAITDGNGGTAND